VAESSGEASVSDAQPRLGLSGGVLTRFSWIRGGLSGPFLAIRGCVDCWRVASVFADVLSLTFFSGDTSVGRAC